MDVHLIMPRNSSSIPGSSQSNKWTSWVSLTSVPKDLRLLIGHLVLKLQTSPRSTI